jgi:hypothetical protein
VLALSTTGWWVIGYAVGGAVVLVAAALLVAIILLAQRIVSQAAAITAALDGAMRNTNALFDVANVNHSLESVSRGLKQARGNPSGGDERTLLQRARSLLPGGGGS